MNMAQALPLTKLAGLVMKSLAKPLSKRIKHEFSRYPTTQRMLVSVGQTSHAITSRMTIWSAGYSVRSIKPLEEEVAMSRGAEFVGESFIFVVSGGIIVWEYNRSREKDRQKNAAKQAELRAESAALQAKLHALDVRLIALEKVVKANSKSILSFGERYVEPTDVVPIDEPILDAKEEEQMPTLQNNIDGEDSSQIPSDNSQKRRAGFGWWPWK